MGYPKRLLTTGEEIVREFRPHWRMLFVPLTWTVLLAAAVIVTFVFSQTPRWLDWTILAVAGVAWLILGAYPLISWWFTLYVLTNERLIARSGILSRHGLEIPLEQINDLSFHQSIIERLLHCGDLLIESAGEQGQSRFSNIPEPEQFHSLLYRVREERTKILQGSHVAPPVPQGDDAVSRLERLARLQSEGMISREEFEAQKKKIMEEK